MSEWAVNVLKRIVRDLDVYLDGRNILESALDTFLVVWNLYTETLLPNNC